MHVYRVPYSGQQTGDLVDDAVERDLALLPVRQVFDLDGPLRPRLFSGAEGGAGR